MKKFFIVMAGVMLAFCESAQAGGLLTNTNQAVAFGRNMARDAAIGIDGVYSNPAGVAFLGEGFHLSLNAQSVWQKRTINTAYGPLFAMNTKNPAAVDQNGMAYREFQGKARVPVFPSVMMAYNFHRVSIQLSAGVLGGGGACEFENGLGSFEGIVAGMAAAVKPYGVNGYSFNSYMKGNQIYYGGNVGVAYKVNDHLSVYGGTRILYGKAHYEGFVKDIAFSTPNGNVPAPQFFKAAGNDTYAMLSSDITVDCKQKGFALAPILGIDYQYGRLNLAAKYEFKTALQLKNKSVNSANCAAIAQLKGFADGGIDYEEAPALLAIGAQYEVIDGVRVGAGWHHYFDRDTKQDYKQTLDDTDEFTFGAEWDINSWLTISAGGQKTNYELEDNHMSDLSFNVSSYSLGGGVKVKVCPKVAINAMYFQTNYGDRNVTAQTNGIDVSNIYTRTNRVVGIGCDIDF